MSNQSRSNKRAARALRILRKVAKDLDYRVGGQGISEFDAFMDDIESGKIVITLAHRMNLQPNKDYWLQGEAGDDE